MHLGVHPYLLSFVLQSLKLFSLHPASISPARLHPLTSFDLLALQPKNPQLASFPTTFCASAPCSLSVFCKSLCSLSLFPLFHHNNPSRPFVSSCGKPTFTQLTRAELSDLFLAFQLSAWRKGCLPNEILVERVWVLGKGGMLLMDLCLSTLHSPPPKCFLESCLVSSGSRGPCVRKNSYCEWLCPGKVTLGHSLARGQ